MGTVSGVCDLGESQKEGLKVSCWILHRELSALLHKTVLFFPKNSVFLYSS